MELTAVQPPAGESHGPDAITVYLRKSDVVGRVVVEKVRGDGARGLADDVPVSMLRSLQEHWVSMGWSVVDERSPSAD